MKELAFQQSGLANPDRAAELGRLMGARIMVMGSVFYIGTDFNISTKVIEVETAKLLGAQILKIPQQQIISYSVQMFNLQRNPFANGMQSLILPGGGQFENEQPIKGGFFLTLEAVALGSSYLLQQMADDKFNKYNRGGVEDVDFYQEGKDLTNIRNGLLVGAGVVWLYNFVDAIWVSSKKSHKVQKEAKGLQLVPQGLSWGGRF